MTVSQAEARPIIGLEIHVQLRTRTKLFCGCPLRDDAPPNTCVCAVCLGHPGALPVLNREAFQLAVLTGMALNCRIAPHTRWDRKSYYYPDLPKNYQISQYDLPIATDGYLEIETTNGPRKVRIRRAHLEEDAGKNIHDRGDSTLVDLNRAGTPLLEIVTEPDLASAEEAFVFCTELHRLIVHLGVGDANMQKGQMRFEPNVNVALDGPGGEARTPIAEVKNLNSFRSVRQAIEYEVARQTAAWREDPDYVMGRRPNENRGWDADRGVTEFQRRKEAAHDYRYFPDPDLTPVNITPALLDEIRAGLGELPATRRRRLVTQFGLSPRDAETLVEHRATAELFEEAVSLGAPAELVAKQLVNVWSSLANDRGASVTALGVPATAIAELATITADGTINRSAANAIAEVLLSRAVSPRQLAEEMGLLQVRDTDATRRWVDEALAANAQAVRDTLANPKKSQAAAGFLRGQVMKLSGGKADPALVATLIEQHLAAHRRPAGGDNNA